MVWPFATSYSAQWEHEDLAIGMFEQIAAGITVSHAPLSTVTSTSIHSSGPMELIGHGLFAKLNTLRCLGFSAGFGSDGVPKAC